MTPAPDRLFWRAIDTFIDDRSAQGRLNSDTSRRSYRSRLTWHAEDVEGKAPAEVSRDDIKVTLRRWDKPNTQYTAWAVLASFYDWCTEEGLRETNPARQVPRPKRQRPSIYRLTRDEVRALLNAVETERERRAIYLAVCAGLRNAELRGLQGRHFRRPGFVWVSSDIAKGGRERWVPVLEELRPVVEDIVVDVGVDEYVLCAQRWRDPGANTERMALKLRPSSPQALYYLVGRVAERAGIAAHIYPHLLRHGFGDHIVRHAGVHNGQALLGHATIATTADIYTGSPSPDELVEAVTGFSFVGR